uniref:Uncharacterized protein n=1 Tax=Trypanosoma vivax (strain Y486) TaxID=1055687 RepID=G0TS19_TRYVY|nr:conserved hypothetical protein [Trypanosoma vivax Y486]
MVSAILPSEFRCFRHITYVYARNLPIHATEAQVEGTCERRCPQQQPSHVSSYFVLSLTPSSSRGCPILNNSDEDRRFYISEVRSGTRHPVWRHIPLEIRKRFASLTRFVLSLYYYSACGTDPHPNPDTDFLLYEMLVETSHVQYVAPSMTKADSLPQLPYHVDSGPNSFVVFLRCADGIFFPLHQGMRAGDGVPSTVQVREGTAPLVTALGTSVASAVLPVSPRESRSGAVLRLIDGVESITLGDVKTCATGTLAWSYLSELATARREEQERLAYARAGKSYQTTSTAASRYALLESRLANVLKQQEQRIQEVHQLLNRCEEVRQSVSSQQQQLDVLEKVIHENEAHRVHAGAALKDREERLSALSTQLDEARRARLRELWELFPVHKEPTSVNDGEAVFTIGGHRLPYWSQTTGVTADLVREWSLALGCVAHVVSAIASLYGCTLPHPLLVCGAHSYVLRRPGLSAATVLSPGGGSSGEVRLPLHGTRASDRPAMAAAVQLLMTNVATLFNVIEEASISSGVTSVVETPESVRCLGDKLYRLSQVLQSPKGDHTVSRTRAPNTI